MARYAYENNTLVSIAGMGGGGSSDDKFVMITATATTVTASKNLATSSSVTRCYPETIS